MTITGTETYSEWTQVVTAGSLTINPGASLTNTNSLVNQTGGIVDNAGTLSSNYWLINRNTLTNQSGATLNAHGKFQNYSTLTNSGSLSTNAGVQNFASASLTNGGSLTTSYHLRNYGTLANQAGATFTNTGGLHNEAGGTVNNAGTLNTSWTDNQGSITNTGNLTATGWFSNSRTLQNQSGGSLTTKSNFINRAGATLTNAGTLTATAGIGNYGTLRNQSGGSLTFGNSIDNEGTLVNEAGATMTGTSYSGLRVRSGTSFTNDGTLSLAGGMGVYGTFDGTGTLNNSGSLSVAKGGTAHIAQSTNLSGGTLTGGSWYVGDVANNGTLSFGDGTTAITAIGAGTMVRMYGSGARFKQLVDNGVTSVNQLGGSLFALASDMQNAAGRDLEVQSTGWLVAVAGTTLTNAGNLTNNSAGTAYGGMTIFQATIANQSGATLTNNGVLVSMTGTLSNASGGAVINNGSIAATGGSTFTNTGSLDNRAAAQLGVDDTSSFTNAGSLTNGVGGTLTNAGTLTNDAAATLTNAGTLTHQAGAAFTNDGTLANATGGTLSVAGELTNSGAITNAGTLDIAADGRVLGTGSFTQSAGATTADGVLQAAAVDIEGGSLFGTGTVEASLSVGAGAFLSPGHSPGSLSVNGDLSLGGTLVMEIEGTTFGTYDVLDVNGNVALGTGSVVSIVFSSLFSPTAGMSWDLVLADAFSGLGNVAYQVSGLGPQHSYEVLSVAGDMGAMLELRVKDAQVPEPGVLALLAFGAWPLGRRPRRRAA